MKTPYSSLTADCLRKKDNIADEYQNKMINHAFMNDIEYTFDRKKEIADAQRIIAIKKDILGASSIFDKSLHQFNLEIPRIIFIGYDNCSKYVSIICDRYNICNDIRNIILSFTIGKRYYNHEKRKMRKQKKLFSDNLKK